MLHKICISCEASLKNVHAMQISPVHIGDCNLPTSFVFLVMTSFVFLVIEKGWGERSP